MATVKDLSEYAGVEVKEMIRLLTDSCPDVNWKAATVVPETLANKFKGAADEYKEADAPIGALASTDGATITSVRLNAEACQYAILESLNQTDIAAIITAAVESSLTEIETYEATKNQVWDAYLARRAKDATARQTAAKERLDKAAGKRQEGISQRMASQQKQSEAAGKRREDAQTFLAQILASGL
jgi:hypothetical protein